MRLNRSLTALVIAVAAIVMGSFWLMAADAQTERERMQEWNTAVVVPLSGSRQVPAVDTDATGMATFWPSQGMNSMCYMVHIDDLDGDVQQVSIHQLQQGGGATGEAVLILSTEQLGDDDDGIIAMGNMTSQDLIGPMAGASMSQFFDEMEAGNLYVNVITDDHPEGEIRGNIDVNMDCQELIALGMEMRDHDHDGGQQGGAGGPAMGPDNGDDDDNDD